MLCDSGMLCQLVRHFSFRTYLLVLSCFCIPQLLVRCCMYSYVLVHCASQPPFFLFRRQVCSKCVEVDFMTGKEALFHKDPHFVPRVFYDIMDGYEQRENNFNSLLLCKERMILFLGYRGFLFSKRRIYIVKTVSLYLPLLARNIC